MWDTVETSTLHLSHDLPLPALRARHAHVLGVRRRLCVPPRRDAGQPTV